MQIDIEMKMTPTATDALFIPFDRPISPTELPTAFTFPFYYTPHPLAEMAANEVMQELESHNNWNHNFGLIPNQEGLEIGKMFGVLIVEDTEGKVGYLKAFSGKIGNSNQHAGYVPPIFDMLNPDDFFKKSEAEFFEFTATITALENSDLLQQSSVDYKKVIEQSTEEIKAHKAYMKKNKDQRKEIRTHAILMMCKTEYDNLCLELVRQSLKDQHELKVLQQHWSAAIAVKKEPLDALLLQIETLKESRKNKSYQIQQLLFDQYNFLNKDGETINVRALFEDAPFHNPPSGAGECATPKLLQYAFEHQLKPLAMAEFWWGKSPVSEIRKHRQYYTACRGKCEPILGFMLQGIPMDENPMLHQESLGSSITTIYEDEHIVVVNKPAEFLSVPGKNISESVLTILQERYPDATGPLLVHRLDMSTSGLLIAGKSKEVHQNLQAQFIKKTVQKRYVALLDGNIEENMGFIELPLRVDIDNRPHQLVCYEHGKMAKTKYKVIERKNGQTKVYFYPITGRTHQLRVHAAHPAGLNTPIWGDDLYGTKADRLYLHAELLEIKHPVTKEKITFHSDPPF